MEAMAGNGIDLSSSEDDLASSSEVEPMEIDDDEDEVMSPALPPKLGVRRKLFTDDEGNRVICPQGASTTHGALKMEDSFTGRGGTA